VARAHVSGCAEADDIGNAARIEHLGCLPAKQAIPPDGAAWARRGRAAEGVARRAGLFLRQRAVGAVREDREVVEGAAVVVAARAVGRVALEYSIHDVCQNAAQQGMPLECRSHESQAVVLTVHQDFMKGGSIPGSPDVGPSPCSDLMKP
jgi:hypothetical protein